MNEILDRLNENAYRYYPFADDADLRMVDSATGVEIMMPVSALLDCRVTSYISDVTTVIVTGVTINPASVVLTFNYAGTELMMTVPPVTDMYTGSVTVTDSGGNVSVHIRAVFGPGIGELCSSVAGTFTMPGTPLIDPSRTLSAANTRVTSVSALDSDNAPAGPTLTGLIFLQEGYNIEAVFSAFDNSVTFNAVKGAGEGFTCGDSPEGGSSCSSAIYGINGLKPNHAGNIIITGSGGITVAGSGNSVILSSNKNVDRPACSDPE